jgi:hypothetical protein
MAEVTQGRTGRRLSLAPRDRDRVAAVAWHTSGTTRVYFQAGSATPAGSGSNAAGGQAAISDLWIPAGSAARARVTRGQGTFGLVAYERSD